MPQAAIERISPFFVVGDLAASQAFYCDGLGFEVLHQGPGAQPFFAIVGRDGAMLFLKVGAVAAQPNPSRDPSIRWDAYLSVPDPDTLAREFAARDVPFSEPLADTHDGLRGFELADPDGYVLFFGRPR